MTQLIVAALAVQGEVSDKFLCNVDEKTIRLHITAIKDIQINRLLPEAAIAHAQKTGNARFPQFTLTNKKGQQFKADGFQNTEHLYSWIRRHL
ncbi:hypothetical protein [Ewingella americana]|uniref:Uncharacterized protein n=1 Tax=Ewingella americana TaxID=41202 RepID=A0A502GH42_9GAMM|nr:hypothetical protein [Ewingella americana]TPG60043.1 hypothetical protein EAH77_15865 [Ewingella americana]